MKHTMLIIVVLAIFLTGTANALVTKTFDGVKTEVDTRLADLPTDSLTKDQKKEVKSLEKALKYFAKESTTSKKDAKLIREIVKVLVKQYPLDQDMTNLLRTSLDGFLGEINGNLAHYKKGNEVLTDGNKKKKAADKKGLKADEASQMAGTEQDPKEKAKLVKKCETKVADYGKATNKAVAKEENLTAHQHKFLNSAPGTYVNATTCLECHPNEAAEMREAGHWNWQGTTANVVGFETEELGKNQIINNFCIAIPSNEGRCTQCHPGYGYKDKTFDFNTNDAALDCLICHDTTGTYKKDKKTAGNPVAGLDYVKIAANVGKPGIANCGACHFSAGGGDNVKKGDLGSPLLTATKDVDVHMGSVATGGQGFACAKCHMTVDHKIPGNQLQDSGRVACTDCHDGTIPGSIHTASHVAKVACQTCHVPTFSRQMATKTHWDWSTAGDKDRTPINDENGKPDYNYMKGDFVWTKNVTPAYRWYNGTWTKTFIGRNDTYTDNQATFDLGSPQGTMADGMIYPFKMMTGVQGGDAVNMRVLVPHLFGLTGGPNPYWVKYDWDGAFADGATYTGLPYSGKYEWINTVMYLAINHEVAPKTMALGSAGKCSDCHGADPIVSLKDLGYTKDPMTGQDL